MLEKTLGIPVRNGKKFMIAFANVHGYRNNEVAITHALKEHKIDILGCSETWLKKKPRLLDPKYTIHINGNRSNKSAGVAIIYKSQYKMTPSN